ncbi:MAG: PLP-dependent aminotransferase family protein [Vicinamibacteria bacterium]
MRERKAAGLLIRVDARRGELQRQIYSGLRQAILDGVVGPGERLPSSRELAADLGVSRTTSQLALEQLLAEGYLTTRRGSGTFVARELPDDAPPLRSSPAPAGLRHPPLSKRGEALVATRPAARRVGGPPRPFRIGTPALDLFPVRIWSQLWSRRLRRATPSQLDYGEAAGFPALRQAIADHVRAARGTRCSADQVFIVPGAQRAIDGICRLLLDPGDEAWLEEPGYPGAHSALVGAGARIHSIRVDDDGLDVEAGERQGVRARLVYVTPSHQFPLGVPMSLARRLALLKWASSVGAWVIEDDYDSEFRYGAHPIPCLHGLDVEGRVIYVGSFSKTLFPSLRLGFMIVPPDLHDTLLTVRRNADTYPPLLDQAVLADFLLEGHFERHLRRMRVVYLERLQALEQALLRRCAGGLRLRPTRTGLHAVADLVEAGSREVFAEATARRVEVTPLDAYFFGSTPSPNALVLGFGSARPDSIDDGVRRLAAAIEAARLS